MYDSHTRALVERAAIAHRDRSPAARPRTDLHRDARPPLIVLVEPLVWLTTIPGWYDPTPEETDGHRAPLLGPAYVAMFDAITMIEHGYVPRKTYFEWLLNKIRSRRVRPEFLDTPEGKRLFGPSTRTRHRWLAAGLYIPTKKTSLMDNLATNHKSTWLDHAREVVESLPLEKRDRRIITMKAEGYEHHQIAVALTISVKTVQRVLRMVQAMVQRAA